jgi:hypothetical protein
MSDKPKALMKMIPLRDFIYLSIILGVILIAVVSFFLGDSDKAGGMLSFSATAVSVVLAVIAIVMTITESTNQKQGILQLKEVTQEIEMQINELRTLNESTQSAFDEVLKLKENLQLQIAAANESTNDMIANLLNSLDKNADEEKVSVAKVKEIVDQAIIKEPVLGYNRFNGKLEYNGLLNGFVSGDSHSIIGGSITVPVKNNRK